MRLGFSPVTATILDPRAAFALAAELELEFVELSADLHEVVPALAAPAAIRELGRATGIGTTVHLSYVDLNLASLSPAARATSVERTLRGLDYAAAIGATCGVLHSGFHYLRHPQADALVADALEASLEALGDGPVPIAMENLALGDDDYLRGPEQLRDLVERHGLGSCLDVGHAHVEGRRDPSVSIEAYALALAPSLIHLHLHDNHGQRDEHLPCGAGTIDYPALVPLLERFEGTACLEIVGGADGVRTAVRSLRALLEVAR